MSDLATLEGVDGFNRLLGDLVQIGGPASNAAAVVKGEVGSLLDACMRYTPQATQKKIRVRASYRFNGKYAIRGSGDLKVTMNTGDRKGEAFAEHVWLRSGGKFYIMRGPGRWGGRSAPEGAHWPDRIWQQYQSLVDQSPEELAQLEKRWIAQALASQGLARQSWSQIAEALGLTLHGADGVRSAKGSDGRDYRNGTATKESTRDRTVFTLSNSMPALVSGRLDGESIITRAFAAREKAFDTALEKGLFQDVEFLAKRYPGLLA